MLTEEGCRTRRERLWRALPEEIEWVLIADPRHVHYLSNFWIHPLSFSAGERGWLLLERDSGATLFCDNFALRSSAGTPYVDREVVEDWYDHTNSVINRDHALLHAIKTASDRLFARQGAVEAEWLPVGAFEVLGLDRETHSVRREAVDSGEGVDLGTVLRSLRRRKEPDEIALISECMRAGGAGQAKAREAAHAGVSEFDIYRAIQAAALEAAGRPGLLYGDFRATSAKVPKAGGLPTAHVLADGELLILDFSVVLEGYRSDFTNTISIGSPTDEQEMLFDLCLAAMRAGERALKAGMPAREVHAAVNEPIRSAGYEDNFGHHAGHGIGLAHPEPPILVPESEDTLEAGDVVTLEPGLYVEGIGGMRFEHNYLVTESGFDRLSDHLVSLT